MVALCARALLAPLLLGWITCTTGALRASCPILSSFAASLSSPQIYKIIYFLQYFIYVSFNLAVFMHNLFEVFVLCCDITKEYHIDLIINTLHKVFFGIYFFMFSVVYAVCIVQVY
jgi:hypothetical protein